MATTDTVTDRATYDTPPAGAGREAPGLALPAPAGLPGVLGSGDHKTIGRLWIGAAGAFGVISLALLAWFAIEATMSTDAQTDRAFLNLTLGLIGLVLGLVVPLFVGLATVVVPLQVGASTIAFPRAAAAALWGWLLSGTLLGVSYLPGVGGGVGGEKVDGSVLTYLSLIGVVASLLLGTICVMTTVVTLRPAGMSLDRVPLFSWSMLVAGGVWLLSLPALVANAAFVIVDLMYGNPSQFAVRDAQWDQLAWFIAPPQALAWAIPALGIVGDVVVTFARGRGAARGGPRQPQRGMLLAALGAVGAVSFGAYVQPAFDDVAFGQWAYIAQVVLGVLPLLVVIGGFATALRRGITKLTAPVVLGLVALLLIALGTLATIPFVIGPLDLQATNASLMESVPTLGSAAGEVPVYTWGVAGLVAVGAIAGAIAGLFHWASKITGRQLPDGTGKLAAPLLLVAGLLVGGPFLALGFANKADGLVDAAGALFIVALAGAVATLAVVGASVASTIAARAAVVGGGATAGDDPWRRGVTLEWATASPPPPGNFAEPPVVASSEPLGQPAAAGGAESHAGGAR